MNEIAGSIKDLEKAKSSSTISPPQESGESVLGAAAAMAGEFNERIGRRRWVICALLFFAATVNYVDRQVIGILKPTLQSEFGWTEVDYGWIVFSFQTAYAIGLFFVGRLMDRVGTKIGFALAGATALLTDYMPELHLTSGRMFKPGLRELIASNVCAQKYADFVTGDKRTMRGGDWQVVGNFDIGKGGGTCVVFGDADVVLNSFSRNTYNVVYLMLESPDRFTALKAAIDANPSMHVAVKHEAEATEDSVKQLNGILNFISYFVGGIMGIAATLGAANSLYAVVDGRRRELATLRALGFRGGAVVASVLTESILLALPGALLGAGLAWILFNGLTASPFGFTFHLAVTAPIALTGIIWALVMGLIGGFLPAIRAARVPVTSAVRAI